MYVKVRDKAISLLNGISLLLLDVKWPILVLLAATPSTNIQITNAPFIKTTNIALKDYVTEYLAIYKEACPNSPNDLINENPLGIVLSYTGDSDFIAICYSPGAIYTTPITIFVDWAQFKKLEPIDKKQVMFHEISHGFLDLEHDDNINNYMYATLQPITEKALLKQLRADFKKHCSVN